MNYFLIVALNLNKVSSFDSGVCVFFYLLPRLRKHLLYLSRKNLSYMICN